MSDIENVDTEYTIYIYIYIYIHTHTHTRKNEILIFGLRTGKKLFVSNTGFK